MALDVAECVFGSAGVEAVLDAAIQVECYLIEVGGLDLISEGTPKRDAEHVAYSAAERLKQIGERLKPGDVHTLIAYHRATELYAATGRVDGANKADLSRL